MRKQETTSHRIAAYIRVSTDEQAENPEGSIKNQEERIRQTVRFKNQEGLFGEIVDVFIDRARSGKDTNRPELQRLLAAIRRKEISLLIVTELSRLSRSIKDFSHIWELMQASGCQFMSLRENFDTTTAAGEMVLYSVANIAQFERRQVSERVSANFNARAQRGLYNGGTVAIGYRLIPDKPGHLAIDPVQAEVVRKCFKAFIDKGSLSLAAKVLNATGVVPTRETQGGGTCRKVGHFTTENLKIILTNKTYLGIRRYELKGEVKETKANWDPIIDEGTFQAAQILLGKMKKRKPEDQSRYPYLLSGSIQCSSCGYSLAGKSAHGNGGKIPYYEHGWAMKKQGCLLQKAFTCFPFRVQARKLEPLVWKEVERLLSEPALAQGIIEKGNVIYKRRAMPKHASEGQRRIQTIQGQIELLAERLATLPKEISPEPVYRQMKRLEAERTSLEATASAARQVFEKPASLQDYELFVNGLREFSDSAPETAKTRIIQALIHKIEITPKGFRLHHYVGQDHVTPRHGQGGPACEGKILNLVSGSNKLTNGWGDRIRTCEWRNQNPLAYHLPTPQRGRRWW